MRLSRIEILLFFYCITQRMAITFDSVIGKQMITSDAYDIGDITDMRYDPFEWNGIGLRFKSKRSEKLAAGFGKANVLILPGKFELNDVMIIAPVLARVKDLAIADNDNMSSLSAVMDSKVVTKDNLLVGTVTNVLIDPSLWKVSSFIVRLDKTAIEAMGMKKGLFAKIIVEVRTDIILSSKDMVHLNEPMANLRERLMVIDS
jgi:sporulation protein YlmC with PRC-barrel domain